MNDYDFRQLSDKEFEVFCCDLLGRHLSSNFERFKSGRDGGVDGRYFSSDGEVILQCKHWINTPLTQLLRSFADVEAPKVARLKPSRYLLAVSQPLSRADKNKISEIFAPYIISQADIFGLEDLNDVLARHQEVERRHYKLWIASTGVLRSILNAPMYGRSDFLLTEIIEDSVRYVSTKNHELALNRLEDKHVVIITGEAGIGKTTLARNVLLPYLADGYELFSIGESIAEAEGVYENKTKQIFYFDDFLGSNYLDAISGNSGAHIANFIRRIVADPLKRFILTSRTTIINQGKILIGALADQNTSRHEFEISLQSISALDRAKILYNHIWHSGLGDEYKEEIYREKRYRIVVYHKNYNPRIVSYVTDSQRLEFVAPGEYWSHVISMFENPAEVWSHPFDAQHDDYGRALILLVALNGRPISQRDLSEAYYRLVSRAGFASARGQQDFLRNLRHLCGSMLNRFMYGASESLMLFNPSIRDFVIARYQEDPTTIRVVLQALRTEESLSTLRAFVATSYVSAEFARDILKSIAKDADDESYVGYSPGYVARLYVFMEEQVGEAWLRQSSALHRAAEFIEREDLPNRFEEVIDFLLMARGLGVDVPHSISRLVDQACERGPSTNELEGLSKLMADVGCEDETTAVFRDAVQSTLVDQMDDEFPASDVFEGLNWDGDWWEAKSQLKDLVRKRLETFGLADDEELVREIAGSYDFDEQAHGYYMSDDDGGGSRRGGRPVDTTSDIDDLFDRS